MKTIVIAGGIGKDAVVRTTQSGDKVTSWSVAVDDRQGQEKRTIWFDCSLWGKRGESLAQYLTKGTRVSVAGDLSTREHEGRTYLTVRADQVTLLGGGERNQQSQGRHPRQDDNYQRPTQGSAPAGGMSTFDDEIPFSAEWR